MSLPNSFKTLKVDRLFINEFQRFFMGQWQYYETVSDFSYTFEFGKSYLLDAKPERGAFAISWAIGGLLKPLFTDTFFLDGQQRSISEMRQLSWCIGVDGYSKLWHFPKIYKSVASQIQEGLKNNKHISEDDLIAKFQLSEGRYKRPLYQHSGERWRSSPAIGYAQGCAIYCFPHMDLQATVPLINYRSSLELVINFLTENGALVIVPAIHDAESDEICDFVVSKNLIDSNYKVY